jgi:hypothetical protein
MRGNFKLMKNQCKNSNQGYSFPHSLSWHFDSNPGHGLPLWGFVIKLVRHTTVSGTPLDE